MEKRNVRFAAGLLAACILLASCSSTALIQSYPSGAKVYADGELRGTTPYYYSDTKVAFSKTQINVEKEGYKPVQTWISRSEQLNGGALVGAFFFWVPVLWLLDYRPVYSYELESTGEVVQEEPTSENPVQEDLLSVKAQQLRELKKLLDEKIITQEEFEKEKKKIFEEK